MFVVFEKPHQRKDAQLCSLCVGFWSTSFFPLALSSSDPIHLPIDPRPRTAPSPTLPFLRFPSLPRPRGSFDFHHQQSDSRARKNTTTKYLCTPTTTQHQHTTRSLPFLHPSSSSSPSFRSIVLSFSPSLFLGRFFFSSAKHFFLCAFSRGHSKRTTQTPQQQQEQQQGETETEKKKKKEQEERASSEHKSLFWFSPCVVPHIAIVARKKHERKGRRRGKQQQTTTTQTNNTEKGLRKRPTLTEETLSEGVVPVNLDHPLLPHPPHRLHLRVEAGESQS